MLKKLDNQMQLFNEIMVSIYLYLLLCLTDFMGEHEVRDKIAWALLSTVVFTVLVNFLKFLIVCDWTFLIRKINKRCLKHKKYEMKNQDTKKNLDKFDYLTNIADQSEQGDKKKRKKKKKIMKKKKKQVRPVHKIRHNDDEIFKT